MLTKLDVLGAYQLILRYLTAKSGKFGKLLVSTN